MTDLKLNNLPTLTDLHHNRDNKKNILTRLINQNDIEKLVLTLI